MIGESDWEPWGCGFDPWPHSVGWGSGVAVGCGVGCRRGSDPALLWLWRRPVAAAPIQPLAWEPPYAVGAALKSNKNFKINYIYTHSFSHIILHHVPSQVISYSSLCYTVGSHLLIHSKCISLHLLTPNSQSIPLPPPWQPQVCSPCPWVCFFAVDRFICALY